MARNHGHVVQAKARQARMDRYVKMIRDGVPRKEIRQSLGISRTTEKSYRDDLIRRGLREFEPQRPDQRARRKKRLEHMERYRSLLQGGSPREEIREAMGISLSCENRWRRELGIYTDTPNELFLSFQALIEAGVDSRMAGIRLGISDRTVLRYRKMLGMPIAPSAVPYPQEVRDKALEMLKEGMSGREVAKTLGLSETRIGRWFPEYMWTTQQSIEYANMVKRLNRIEGLDGIKKLS